MYTLYTRAGTGGFVAEAALAMSGAPFTCTDVLKADAREAAFRRISPLGQVPALVLSDGTVMTESAAMCLLIADNHPDSGLAPAVGSHGRAPFLRWMMFMNTVIYPALLRLYYTDRYTTDAAGLEPVQAAALAEIDRAFDIIEQGLERHKWLAGNAFSIADAYLLMLAHWMPGDKPRPEWTRIVALCERLKSNPVLARLNERHRLW